MVVTGRFYCIYNRCPGTQANNVKLSIYGILLDKDVLYETYYIGMFLFVSDFILATLNESGPLLKYDPLKISYKDQINIHKHFFTLNGACGSRSFERFCFLKSDVNVYDHNQMYNIFVVVNHNVIKCCKWPVMCEIWKLLTLTVLSLVIQSPHDDVITYERFSAMVALC